METFPNWEPVNHETPNRRHYMQIHPEATKSWSPNLNKAMVGGLQHGAHLKPLQKVQEFLEERPLSAAIISLASAYDAHNIESSVRAKAECGLQQGPQLRRDVCSGLQRQAALCNCCQSFSQLGRSRLKATSRMVSLMLTATLCFPDSPSTPTWRWLSCTWSGAHLIVKAVLGLLLSGPQVLRFLQQDLRRDLPTASPISFRFCSWQSPCHCLWSWASYVANWLHQEWKRQMIFHLLTEGRDRKTWLVSEGRPQWRQKEYHLSLLDLSHGITLGNLCFPCNPKSICIFQLRPSKHFPSFLLYET